MSKKISYPGTTFGNLPEGAVFALPNRLPGARYIKTHSSDRVVYGHGRGLYRVYRAEEGGAVGYVHECDDNQVVWLAENAPPGM